MKEQNSISLKRLQQRCVSRRHLIRGVAAATLGAGFLRTKPAYADHKDDNGRQFQGPLLKPIPGGVVPFEPFGVPVHHNPLNPANLLANISDPSEITDFDGFVGLTHIRGGGTGTDTSTGVTTPLAYQADMGFGQGKFVGIDGHLHRGTFAFV
ncbi:MAG: hypothetical protein WB869_13310 [Candidatus Acidiferrales bacterium]